MAYTFMAYVVMASVVMAHVVMAYIVIVNITWPPINRASMSVHVSIRRYAFR